MHDHLKVLTGNASFKKKSSCSHGHAPNAMKQFLIEYHKKCNRLDGIVEDSSRSNQDEKKKQKEIKFE
jgi:hypothetical protein